MKPLTEAFKKRVWGGDPTTYDEARFRFEEDPEGEIVSYAVYLYSFRNRGEMAKELLKLRPNVTHEAAKFLELSKMLSPYGGMTLANMADRADVLSTHLTWFAQHSKVSKEERPLLYALALKVTMRGLEVFKMYENEDASLGQVHTSCLLMLTSAEICWNVWRSTRKDEALNYLEAVAEEAASISDPNQRARVYRKLGMLLRRFGRWGEGLWYGMVACLVRGTPRAVRLKSLAALLGIQR